MSKYKINNQKEFISLAKLIKPNKSYNVTILEAKVRDSGFTDRQLEQLGKIIATTVPQIIAKTVPPLIEAALIPINKRLDKIEERLDRLEDFAVKQLAFNELLLSLPTIKKEIEDSKKKK